MIGVLWQAEPPPRPPGRPLPRAIIAEVAARYGLTVADLTGQSRCKNVVHPRQEAMWELRRRTRLSLPAIGRFLGGRDHCTIFRGLQRHEARLAEQAQGDAA